MENGVSLLLCFTLLLGLFTIISQTYKAAVSKPGKKFKIRIINYDDKKYFKTVLRNFRRNKIFSLINVLGLAIGISASLVIYLLVN